MSDLKITKKIDESAKIFVDGIDITEELCTEYGKQATLIFDNVGNNKLYGINKKCIKCGAEDAIIEFKGSVAKAEWAETLNDLNNFRFNEPRKSEDEKILVTCNCCGYAWLEKPLDCSV